ncbi:hypothetical protein [Legionella sp. CNM-4043-24]|uniref:hypothetical protein n=1 Tax=Legionella sp. CNM-4043-24 TaxID=3421646 RepID=UPI00403AE7BD
MALSFAEQVMLQSKYDELRELTTYPNRFANNKEQLIRFCIDNDILLYNLAHLHFATGQNLLNRVLHIVTGRSAEVLKDWRRDFSAASAQADALTRQTYARAYLSVADQHAKMGFFAEESLLTMEDMKTLLANPGYHSEDVLTMEPFSLTERTQSQDEELGKLLASENVPIIFLPVNHDGHWFYLIRFENSWRVRDSQKMQEEGLSQRQLSMMQATQKLLTDFGVTETVTFETTGAQFNDYDCGTHVLNAWRYITSPDGGFSPLTHSQALREALFHQQDKIEPALSAVEELEEESSLSSVEEMVEYHEPVLPATQEKTVPSAEAAVAEYTQALLANKHGLFSGIHNKIDINQIDQAIALHGESDEDFAHRLQEAEFRKAGLI